jgi:hypothetical protein
MKSLTTSSQVFYISFLFICGTTLFSSCSKHAKKVKGNYVGTLSINDTVMSNNANINIAELEDNVISVSSNYFNTYFVEIDKNRYFNSITYYSVEDNETIEVNNHGNIILIHEQDGEEFVFIGDLN